MTWCTTYLSLQKELLETSSNPWLPWPKAWCWCHRGSRCSACTWSAARQGTHGDAVKWQSLFRIFWVDVPAGDVFFLRGELGSGKTSLAVPLEGEWRWWFKTAVRLGFLSWVSDPSTSLYLHIPNPTGSSDFEPMLRPEGFCAPSSEIPPWTCRRHRTCSTAADRVMRADAASNDLGRLALTGQVVCWTEAALFLQQF